LANLKFGSLKVSSVLYRKMTLSPIKLLKLASVKAFPGFTVPGNPNVISGGFIHKVAEIDPNFIKAFSVKPLLTKTGKKYFLAVYCKACGCSDPELICGGCNDFYYCDSHCQKYDRKEHKVKCKQDKEQRRQELNFMVNYGLKAGGNVIFTASKKFTQILLKELDVERVGEMNKSVLIPGPGVKRLETDDGYCDIYDSTAKLPYPLTQTDAQVVMITACVVCGTYSDRTCSKCKDYIICSKTCDKLSSHYQNCGK
jgi:hypothetical protein